MGYLLKNPSGRIVEVDDRDMFKKFLSTKGFDLPTPEEKKRFRGKQDELFDESASKGKLRIQYAAPAPRHDGYGQSQNHIKDALEKEGVILESKYNGQQIGLAYGYPGRIEHLKTPIRIWFSMFESTKIPDSWVAEAKEADHIIVPSKFCQKAFKKSGFVAEVFNLGYDASVFTFAPKDYNKKTFTFLHYDAFNQRKGWDIVFKAFNEEFDKKEPVELILKTTKIKLPFPIIRSQYPNIKVLKDIMKHGDIAKLLQDSDCFVLPSRGEGFGHPPLESLACGTPVIVSNATGHKEYFTKEYFFGIKATKEIPALYRKFHGEDVGKMVEPDLEDLKRQMRFVFEHRSYAYNVAKEGAKWVKKNWTYKQSAVRLADYLKNISETEKPVVKAESKPKVEGEKPQLSIVILTYDRLKDTQECIEAVRKNTVKTYELIVVDNGSKDETVKWLKKQRDISHLILNKENVGIPIARNQGMKKATGEYICILDNDLFVGKGWDHFLAGSLESADKAGIVGINGSIVENYNPLHFIAPLNPDKIAECDVVPGCLQLFRRDILQRVGYLDEDMPNPKFWHEDMGFCRRIRESGLKVYTLTGVPHRHRGGLSHVRPDKAPHGYFENAAYVERKHTTDKTLIIHRDIHDENCSESFCVLARNISREMRKLGFNVLRKDSVHTKPITFDFCKAFDMKFNGKRFILLHLENDRPPKEWLKSMKPVDYAFTVSPHAYHNAIKWGFPRSKMINTSPNGVDESIFNFKVEPFDFMPNKFKFLTVGASQPRKGTDVLIKAYFNEFTGDDKTVLVIKDYMYGWEKWTKDLIKAEQKKHSNPPEVSHIFEDWPIEKLAGVYKAVALNGAFFHPFKGECFGLPIIEALACGARVGVTNYTGPKYTMKEFAKDYPKHVHLFDYKMGDSTFHNWKDEPYYEKDENPQWALADIKDCREWARRVYEEKYDPKIARTVSKRIIDKFKWENTVKRMARQFKEYGRK